MAVASVGAIGVAACSSSSTSSTTTTTTLRQFQVMTPDGQVSLSLDGRLPPNWPADAPVPEGAKVAGSGSLVSGSQGVLIGVYSTSQAPDKVYNFYTTSSDVTVASSSAVGSGSAFIGTVRVTAPVQANVVVLAHEGVTYIVMEVTPTGSATSTT